MNAIEVDDNYKCLMEYWFPFIENMEKSLSGIRIPKTTSVAITDNDLFRDFMYQEASREEYDFLIGYINTTRIKAGIGLPFFLRTGLSSDKHSWKDSCYVTDSSSNKMTLNINALFESDANKMGVRMSPFLFIREYIEMNAPFKAFNGMPIAREFRLFSDDGSLTHIQPYWIPDAIADATDDNWIELLKEQHKITKEEKELLVKAASRVTRNIKGHWSVDFCQSKDGKWYLIDMAIADRSFKWYPDIFDWSFKSNDEKRAEMESEFKKELEEGGLVDL